MLHISVRITVDMNSYRHAAMRIQSVFRMRQARKRYLQVPTQQIALCQLPPVVSGFLVSVYRPCPSATDPRPD
jgi:hypothetical protein